MIPSCTVILDCRGVSRYVGYVVFCCPQKRNIPFHSHLCWWLSCFTCFNHHSSSTFTDSLATSCRSATSFCMAGRLALETISCLGKICFFRHTNTSCPCFFTEQIWPIPRHVQSDPWATPLKNMISSVGMMIPNIWKNEKCSKPSTSHPPTSSIWRKTGQYMKWVSKSASGRTVLWGFRGPWAPKGIGKC